MTEAYCVTYEPLIGSYQDFWPVKCIKSQETDLKPRRTCVKIYMMCMFWSHKLFKVKFPGRGVHSTSSHKNHLPYNQPKTFDGLNYPHILK